jgi:hypothetical protein
VTETLLEYLSPPPPPPPPEPVPLYPPPPAPITTKLIEVTPVGAVHVKLPEEAKYACPVTALVVMLLLDPLAALAPTELFALTVNV